MSASPAMRPTLTLTNTLTREKEVFVPEDASNVRMYVCGPTVYDYAHIGNARPVVVFDVLYRLLRHLYGAEHVKYVRNITDVDDKINARAAEEAISIRELTERTAEQFHADMHALGALDPNVEPRATEHIAEMKAMIEDLVKKGHAYVAEGHVLFDVASMEDYGRLSGRSLEDMQAGARVEVAPYKKGPMDFVLWKPSKEGEPGWPSPCGIQAKGRPGWHIECSAMAGKHLGDTFDIHGGGVDLVFPHHENEVAQSRCSHGTDVMARYWLHNGFLQVEGEKMSKSLGNFITVHELLATEKFGGRRWPGLAVRLALLQTHYRQPINWTLENLKEAEAEMARWANSVSNLSTRSAGPDMDDSVPSEVLQPLLDDLNTPGAIAGLRKLYNLSHGNEPATYKFMKALEFLGLYNPATIAAYISGTSGSAHISSHLEFRNLYVNVRAAAANNDIEFINSANAEISSKGLVFSIGNDGGVDLDKLKTDGTIGRIEDLIQKRLAARAAKDWAEADRIRNELASEGVLLEDKRDPETGEIKTSWELK